ncbi:MAG: hypothetical protein MJ072_05620, partial [Clostridia bacterium]|nr:hypothetical protein [Clostridia bacterium]
MADLNRYLDLNTRVGSLKELYETYRHGVPVSAFGVPESAKNHIISYLDGKILYVVRDFVEGTEAVAEINALGKKKAVFIPEKEELLFSARAYSRESSYKRLSALYALQTGKADVAVVTAIGALQLYPKEIKSFTLEKDGEYDRDFILSSLVNEGYVRRDGVENKGSFSLRGDILDVFPTESELPVRIDFFGDTVERIRYYDQDTGKTVEILEKITLISADENVVPEEIKGEIISEIKEERRSFKGKNNVRFAEFTDSLIE